MTGLSFNERLTGHVAFGQEDFNEGLRRGRRDGTALALDLVIDIADVDAFLAEPQHTAELRGTLDCGPLGGRLAIEHGVFNLFVDDEADHRRKRMRYTAQAVDREGRPVTLVGFKEVVDGPGLDIWSDTTTLFVSLHAGPTAAYPVIAAGIVRITHAGFLRMLLSMRPRKGSPWRRARAVARFQTHFLGELRQAYRGQAAISDRSDLPDGDPLRGHPEGEWHDLPGHAGLKRRILLVEAGDGHPMTLHQIRGEQLPRGRPVLCLHGAGVRGDLFYGPPGGACLARSLVDAGRDVWVSNWRASMDLPPSVYALDHAAVYDHPVAIAKVREQTGAATIDVIAHCQGATSFTMTALAGLAPDVENVVASAVSLHAIAPWRTRIKGRVLLPIAGWRLPYFNAQWAVRSPSAIATAFVRIARLVRRECDNGVCAMGNYLYGTGPDVLWVHANLTDDGHDWISREFGFVPHRLLWQMARSARKGHVLPVEGLPQLPANLLSCDVPEGQRWTFLVGTKNCLYPPECQVRSHAWFEARDPGRHRLVELEGFGHLDPLFGRDAAVEAHPAFLQGVADPQGAGATVGA